MDILEKYCNYAKTSTDAPTIYHKYLAAAMMGTIMGRRLWYQHGHQRIYPNIWVCLVGPSTWSKKSTSISIAEYLISRINEQLLFPSKITTEKLYSVLSERPTGLMRFGELHILLSQMQREYNVELKSTLTDFYDSPPHRSYDTKGGGLVEVRYPALSIMAGTTTDWLVDAAKTRDICAGFYPRWQFVIADKSDQPDMPIPAPRDENKADAIIESCREIQTMYNMEAPDPSGKMSMDKEAQAAYSAIYSSMKNQYYSHQLLGPFSGRTLVAVIKYSMIHAIATRRSTSIGIKDIEYGYEMAKASMESINRLVEYELGETRTEQYLNRYRKMLIAAGKSGLTRRDLQVKGPVRDPLFLDRLLNMLIVHEYAVTKPGATKRSVIYLSTEIPKEDSDGGEEWSHQEQG